ncbi:hypothetical protein H632_c13p3 [Helicosporidium sp. ATCC 50920]|nr:hypothetical protein H632_c13p3 [Helicosporidium sp. ATCC 50920]|eukprot:KDD77127.1 hypothetical protein H632_c13p3 [Helicosporidium sp. ATCC 50920]
MLPRRNTMSRAGLFGALCLGVLLASLPLAAASARRSLQEGAETATSRDALTLSLDADGAAQADSGLASALAAASDALSDGAAAVAEGVVASSSSGAASSASSSQSSSATAQKGASSSAEALSAADRAASIPASTEQDAIETLLHPHLAMVARTRVGQLTIPEVCTAERARELAEVFSKHRADNPGWTACGSSRYLEEFNDLSPQGRKVMIDVGCNKGYSSAKFFALWAPEVGLTPPEIVKRRPSVWCGNCNDCQEEIRSRSKAQGAQLTVLCLEPSQSNFADLVQTRDAFFSTNSPDVQWLTLNLAASNATGTARFSRECTSEQCSLGEAAAHNSDLIETTTVDGLLAHHAVDFVDVLKIDAEGYDATVLQGAAQTLAARRVRLLSFEYHGVGFWPKTRLRGVVQWLAGLDYVCYFDGQPHLARLTGCWDEAYEFHDWSNVVCVQRDSSLYARLERLSIRFRDHPEVYLD